MKCQYCNNTTNKFNKDRYENIYFPVCISHYSYKRETIIMPEYLPEEQADNYRFRMLKKFKKN